MAVFPLLDHVLFPGTTMPLRILEERYALMLRDILDNHWPLAVALVTPQEHARPGDDGEFFLNTICGAGPVEILKEYNDGRKDIFVHGRTRVKLHEFIQKEPYFIMEASLLETSDLAVPKAVRRITAFDDFRELVKTWVFLNPLIEEREALIFNQFEAPGELTDFFVFHYLKRALDKQGYLNCLDATLRAEMLTEFLKTDLRRLSRKLGQTEKSRLIH